MRFPKIPLDPSKGSPHRDRGFYGILEQLLPPDPKPPARPTVPPPTCGTLPPPLAPLLDLLGSRRGLGR